MASEKNRAGVGRLTLSCVARSEMTGSKWSQELDGARKKEGRQTDWPGWRVWNNGQQARLNLASITLFYLMIYHYLRDEELSSSPSSCDIYNVAYMSGEE